MAMQDLADAIVLQAVSDYRRALRHGVFKYYGKKVDFVTDCESFFTSDWFRMLTRLNGKHLMRKLKEEYENECKGKN